MAERSTDEARQDLQTCVLQSTLQEVAARSDDDASCCVICLDAVTDQCEAVPCGHADFDYVCALSWLLQTPLCPLCKTPVDSLLHGPVGKAERPVAKIEPKKDKPSGTPGNRPTGARSSRATLEQVERRRARRQGPGMGRRYEGTVEMGEALRRRKMVYERLLYSKHVGSNRLSRYRELTPQMFCSDEELTSRARMWIRRELQVFSFLSPSGDSSDPSRPRNAADARRASNAEFLLEYVVAVLKSVDIMGSMGQAEDMISDFLGRENGRLFLHELRAWLRSPFGRLEDWDRAVQYPESNDTRRSETRHSTQQGSSRANARGAFKGDFYRPGRRVGPYERARRRPSRPVRRSEE